MSRQPKIGNLCVERIVEKYVALRDERDERAIKLEYRILTPRKSP